MLSCAHLLTRRLQQCGGPYYYGTGASTCPTEEGGVPAPKQGSGDSGADTYGFQNGGSKEPSKEASSPQGEGSGTGGGSGKEGGSGGQGSEPSVESKEPSVETSAGASSPQGEKPGVAGGSGKGGGSEGKGSEDSGRKETTSGKGTPSGDKHTAKEVRTNRKSSLRRAILLPDSHATQPACYMSSKLHVVRICIKGDLSQPHPPLPKLLSMSATLWRGPAAVAAQRCATNNAFHIAHFAILTSHMSCRAYS